jgi:hypothetical protein
MANESLAVVPVAVPPMSAFEKYRQQLEPSVDFRTGGDDFAIITVKRDRLIPVAACRAIIAEIDAASRLASPEVAAQLCTLLVGSYPAREVMDAKIFVRVFSATFEEFPADIGLNAVDTLTRRSKWLPTRAELVEMLEDLQKRRHHARRVAEAHLEEHRAPSPFPTWQVREEMRWHAEAIGRGTYFPSITAHDVRGMIKMGWVTKEQAISTGYPLG